MRLEGERVKKIRYVRTERYIIVVEVEAVIPRGDPSEPCYESETVKFLKEVWEHAESGDEAWLRQHGKVYVAAAAA